MWVSFACPQSIVVEIAGKRTLGMTLELKASFRKPEAERIDALKLPERVSIASSNVRQAANDGSLAYTVLSDLASRNCGAVRP
jgi:hypothetical protein